MKRCPKCNGYKPAVDYYYRKTGFGAGTPISVCKSCKAAIAKDFKRRKKTGDLKERYIAMVGSDYRICCDCRKVKSVTEFYICKTGKSKGSPQGKCKVCNVRSSTEYAKQSHVKKRYSQTRREKRLESYGITVSEFELMEKSQNGLCAICKKKPPHILRIDHDHKTGRLRGLLCLSCNAALGWVEHNYESVEKYLLHYDSHPLYSKDDLIHDRMESLNE